jgi:hypothetical protein
MSNCWRWTLILLSILSVWKVVPPLTSKSAEICLSMAGAKQLATRGLSWFRPGPYVQQWCAQGTVLCCTVVVAEGSYKRGGRGGSASRSPRFDWGKVPISWRRQWAWSVLSVGPPPPPPPRLGDRLSFYKPRGDGLQSYHTVLITCSGMVHSVVE